MATGTGNSHAAPTVPSAAPASNGGTPNTEEITVTPAPLPSVMNTARATRDILLGAIAMVTIVGMIVLIAYHYKTADEAVVLISAVLPAMLALGAAALGANVGYRRGAEQGEQVGAARTNADLQPTIQTIRSAAAALDNSAGNSTEHANSVARIQTAAATLQAKTVR